MQNQLILNRKGNGQNTKNNSNLKDEFNNGNQQEETSEDFGGPNAASDRDFDHKSDEKEDRADKEDGQSSSSEKSSPSKKDIEQKNSGTLLKGMIDDQEKKPIT